MASGWRTIVAVLSFPFLISAAGCLVGNGARPNGRSDGGPTWTHVEGGPGAEGTAQDAGAYDGSPTVLAPRPIAPLSTATVTSQKPTLHWALADQTDGAHIQICRDRGCTKQVTSFDADGASGAPSSKLPAGTLFWRAYGRSDGVRGRDPSPTWQLTVGRRTAPVDTSWGTTLDLNGDGYADIIVGSPYGGSGAGQAYVYLGSATGMASSSAVVLTDPEGPNRYFGAAVAGAGDVNGDGYADLLVSEGAGGNVSLFLGSASGVVPTRAVKLTSPNPASGDGFGNHVGGAGDVNGDGYADVVIAASGSAGEKVYLFLGSATGLASLPDGGLSGPGGPQSGFGHWVEGAGDVNGDGYADVAVADLGASNGSGQVYLFLGSATGLASSPAATLTGPDGNSSEFGRMACAGDVNGDGYADIVVGSYGANNSVGRAYVYLGSNTGLASSPAVALDGPDGPGGLFGRWVAGAGDVNGDGYADIIVGADGEAASPMPGGTDTGWAHVYFGSATGVSSSSTVTLNGPDGAGAWFGRSVAGAGDVNGDGYADVLVGADSGGLTTGPGWAHLYQGSATGLATSPAVTLTGPNAGSDFGISVASASGGFTRVLPKLVFWVWRGARSG